MLALAGLLFPAEIPVNGGVARWMCDLGRQVPIVRSLDTSMRYTCALSVSLGGAVYFGFLVGVLLCFCRLHDPIPIRQFIAADWKKKISLLLIVVIFLGGTWTTNTAPLIGGIFRFISLSRITIAIVAPGYLFAHALMWSLALFYVKFCFGIRHEFY
jgi:hypothetical protein